MDAGREEEAKLVAIVLAAGAGVRMGGANKLLLDYMGRPMIAHVVATILDSVIDEVVVVTGNQSEQVEAAVKRAVPTDGVRFACNTRWSEGMITSIQTGVVAFAGQRVAGFAICLGDMPLIRSSDVSELAVLLLDKVDGDARAIVAPRHGGQHGHPVIFAGAYRSDIVAERGPGGCRSILERYREHVAWIDMPDRVLADVDTPEAYARIIE